MEIDKKSVGGRIKSLRLSQNWSMDELAKRAGVSGKSTVNEWEKGRSLPNESTLERLGKLFSVTPGYITFGNFDGYIFKFLSNEGMKNNNFNSAVWEYIELTTDTERILTGIATNLDGTVADDETQGQINQNIISGAVRDAISDNLQSILGKIKERQIKYSDTDSIITIATEVVRFNNRIVKQSFVGKIHQLRDVFDRLNSYELLNSKISLEEYINDENMPFFPHSDDFRSKTEEKIDMYYQAKLNNLLMFTFSDELGHLLSAYEMDKKKYLNDN